ncbi:MAG: Hpt domain-containing protein [Clostridiales bacterium]|nr:Hpt domain-containing protein [Clostridiales bacterium]
MLEEIKALGANIDEGLKRFMNNSALYERCLKKYIAQAEKCNMLDEIQSGDFESAARSAHTMKGVASNLSLTPLYELYAEVVLRIRENNTEGLEEIAEKCIKIEKEFCDVISKYQ